MATTSKQNTPTTTPTNPVIEGGPSGMASPPPELVEVTVGGNTFMVAPEAAEAFRSREEELLTQVNTSRHVSPPNREDRRQEEPEHKEQQSYQERIFLDPDGVLNEFREQLKTEMRSEYEQERGKERFWNTFYDKNPDLKEHDFLVKAVLARDWNDLEGLTGEDALTQLANRSKAAILGFAGKSGGKGNDTQNLEGGTTKTPPARTPAKAAEEDKPYGLSAAIRERRKGKRLNKES